MPAAPRWFVPACLALLGACERDRAPADAAPTRPPPAATRPADAAPAVVDAPAAVDAGPAVDAPTPAPEGFTVDTRVEDVDRDGRDDLVRTLPSVARRGAAPLTFGELPPALVAHRLPDGRYAVDDDLARAALRALCPEAPSPRFTFDGSPSADEPRDLDAAERELRARALFLDALCARAWGRSADEVAAALRAAVAPPDAATAPAVGADLVAAMVRALATVRLPFVLRPLEATLPATPEPAARDAGAADAGAPAAAVDPACAAVDAANERRREGAVRVGMRLAERARDAAPPAYGDPSTELVDSRRCLPTGPGVWSLRFAALTFRMNDDGLHGPAQLAFAPRSGAERVAPLTLPEEWAQGTVASHVFGLERAFDWDRDGRPEVAVAASYWEHEGESGAPLTLYGARGGAVAPYAPAAEFNGRILGITDADGDGRPDLVLPTAWRFVDGCGMSGIAHEGPRLLAHALPDGTFSTRDAAARAFVTTACAARGEPGPSDDADVWRVACARVAGATPERIVAALRPDHAGRPRLQPLNNDQQVCYPFQALASLALIAPPFSHRAR